eukprot:snap_masked-scaffold_11-processed-gene-7.24-mRNA-1 protein AED:1.00 eAED:1.00 QI:0/-1/0/0/-1/1/1/0/105
MRLPCRHYGRICIQENWSIYEKRFPLPRWRYEEHPFYEVALQNLGRFPVSKPNTMELKARVPNLGNSKAPGKSSSKFSRLMTECKLLCTEAYYLGAGEEYWLQLS